MSTPTNQAAIQPDGWSPTIDQGDRTYRNAGLAIVSLGIIVLMQDAEVRDLCARVLRDPDVLEACRDLIARVISK